MHAQGIPNAGTKMCLWEFQGCIRLGPWSPRNACPGQLERARSLTCPCFPTLKPKNVIPCWPKNGIILPMLWPQILGICGATKGIGVCLLGLCASINIFMAAQRWHLFPPLFFAINLINDGTKLGDKPVVNFCNVFSGLCNPTALTDNCKSVS